MIISGANRATGKVVTILEENRVESSKTKSRCGLKCSRSPDAPNYNKKVRKQVVYSSATKY